MNMKNQVNQSEGKTYKDNEDVNIQRVKEW